MQSPCSLSGLSDAALTHLILVGYVVVDSHGNPALGITQVPGMAPAFAATKSTTIQSLWLMAPSAGDMNSTSTATAVVSGALALLESRWPVLYQNGTAAQVLFQTAQDLGAPGVDPTYGNGLLRIDRAMQPVGSLTVQTAVAASVPVGNGAALQASSATGALPKLTSALSNFTAFDSFGRDFTVNLAGLVAQNSKSSTQAIAATAPQPTVSAAHFADGSTLSFASQDPMNFSGVDKLTGHAADKNWMTSFADASGSVVSAGQGFPASASFAGALWGGDSAVADQASSLGVTSSVVALAEGGTFASYGTPIGHHTRMALGWTQSKAADPIANNGWVSPDSSAFNAGIATQLADGWSGGMTVSMLSENGGMLGSTYDKNGPLSFGNNNRTVSLGVSSGYNITDTTSLLLEAAVARTNGSKASGLISDVSSIYAVSYGASLAQRDVHAQGDRFELSLKTPLQVVSGTATLTTNSVDAFGNPIVGSQHIGLTPDGHELDLTATYQAPVTDDLSWNVSLTGRHDADNVAGSADLVTRVAATIRF